MSDPLYPDVPIAPGVPAVLRVAPAPIGSLVNSQQNVNIGAAQGRVGAPPDVIGGGFAAANGAISNVQNVGTSTSPNLVNGAFGQSPTLMMADVPDVASIAASSQGQWGIFNQDNNQVLVPDSFKGLDYKQDWRMPNYPMEQGSFQSYNKVEMPFEVKVELTKGGSDDARRSFLESLDEISASTDLYSVVTPEYTYLNVNVEGNGYKRSATNGAKLLTVDVSLLEIRQAPPSQFTNTANPSGADSVNGGTVQAIPVTTSATLNSDGAPASSAQFESGLAAPDTVNSAASPSETSAVAASQTPSVSATPPVFDGNPRDSNGNLVTPLSKNPYTGRITTPNGYTQVSDATGITMQYDAAGDVIKKIDPGTVQ